MDYFEGLSQVVADYEEHARSPNRTIDAAGWQTLRD